MSTQQPASGYGYCGVPGELPDLSGFENAMEAHVGVQYASVRTTPESREWVNRLALRNRTEFALQKTPEPAVPEVNGCKLRRKDNDRKARYQLRSM